MLLITFGRPYSAFAEKLPDGIHKLKDGRRMKIQGGRRVKMTPEELAQGKKKPQKPSRKPTASTPKPKTTSPKSTSSPSKRSKQIEYINQLVVQKAKSFDPIAATKADLKGFRRAKTGEEAHQRLSKIFDGRVVVQPGAKKDVHFMNSVLAGVESFKRKGLSLPKSLVLADSLTDGLVGRYSIQNQAVTYTLDGFNETQLIASAYGKEEVPWHHDPLHPIFHELGHHRHNVGGDMKKSEIADSSVAEIMRTVGMGMGFASGVLTVKGVATGNVPVAAVGALGMIGAKKLMSWKIDDRFEKCKKECEDKVTRYAMSDPLEFVAEVYAGLHLGQKFDKSVMTWFKEFGGVYP